MIRIGLSLHLSTACQDSPSIDENMSDFWPLPPVLILRIPKTHTKAGMTMVVALRISNSECSVKRQERSDNIALGDKNIFGWFVQVLYFPVL